MLRVGSSGVNVRKAQDLLNKKTIFPSTTKALVLDGQFGRLTEEMVKLFQAQNSLPVTGIIDNATGTKLGMFPSELQSAPITTSVIPSTSTMPKISSPGFFEQNKKNIMILAGGLGLVLVISLMARQRMMEEVQVKPNPKKRT